MTKPIDAILDAVKWEVLPPREDGADGIPYATHRGVFKIGEHELECYVLNTGQRIFTADSVHRFFGVDA